MGESELTFWEREAVRLGRPLSKDTKQKINKITQAAMEKHPGTTAPAPPAKKR